MEEKIKRLEKFMAAEGLTLVDVNAYYANERKKQELAQELKKEEARQKIAEIFPADDVRSKALLYDFAFEGGKFSSDPNAYPNCQGVVGWINPDPDAPEGDRVYVILIVNGGYCYGRPEQLKRQFSDKNCFTGVTNEYDGRANTMKLLEYGKEHGVSFPAAEFAFNYCKNGVKKGEAFLPAKEQVDRVKTNYESEDMMLNLPVIGCACQGYMLSSTEISADKVWSCSTSSWKSDVFLKNKPDTISCFLAY